MRMPIHDARCWAAVVRLAAQIASPHTPPIAPPKELNGDSAAAQELFDKARGLMKQGDYASACAKFEESLRLERATGTLINLARCHERAGKTAAAWTEFHDALAQATLDGRPDRVAEARRRIAELQPRLGWLTVVVDVTTPRLAIRIDGVELGVGSWGTAQAVDPGPHQVAAQAPGRTSWMARVDVARREQATVEIPELASEGPPVLPTARSSEAPVSQPLARHGPVAAARVPVAAGREREGRPPPAAWVVGGFGVVGIAVGAYFGLQAMNRKDDSLAYCQPSGCTDRGATLLADARVAAWASDAGFATGAALLTGAAYWIWSSTRTTAKRVSWRIAPNLGTQAVAMNANFSW